MADPTIARSLTARVSRLSGKDRLISHTHSTMGYDWKWPLPSDAVEVVRGTHNLGLYDLHKTLSNPKDIPVPKNSWITGKESRSGVMTIFSGSTSAYSKWLGFSRIIREVNKMAARRGRNVLLLRDTLDSPLNEYFEKRSLYDFKGYYDWGVTYVPKDSDLTALGLVSDVSCFWTSDHSIGTLLLPGTTTLGGMLKAKTVMRKADIMVSTYPPYEYLRFAEDGYPYPEEAIEQSKLVSEARKIWNPDTHYFSGTREQRGKLLARGDQRMLTLSGRGRGRHVIRWSRGDLEKGPINDPSGYPVNPLYYTLR